MKKLFLIILSLFTFNSFTQTINISTGLDASSISLAAVGTNDGNWRYGTAINGSGIPKAINFYSGYWNPTPITSTGAHFIGNTGNLMAQNPGLYYFERTFSVSSGIGLLSTAFGIAIDDDLKSVELIDPSGTPVDLTSKFIRSTTPSPYYLSKDIRHEIKCPTPGKWKIRILANFIDTAAGLLVSGNVIMSGQCQTDQSYEDSKCCTSDKAQNLSTGYRNTSNSLIPNNSPDDDWKIVSSPSGVPSAVVYSPSPAGYAPASTKAQWIGPKGVVSNGLYKYERTIIVPPGFEANLTFSRIGGDNEVDLLVDGSLQYHSSFPSAVGSKAFTAANVILKNVFP